jgi:hemolysin activation/secretion protein
MSSKYINRCRSTWVLWRQIKNPTLYQNLSLGDENGLRGFSLRGRTGAKMLLANFESRLRTDIRFWFLRLGFTAFVDLGGETWDENEAVNLTELKSSFGMGLRIGNAKYAAGINRIDFAYNTYNGTWQISIGTGSYFSAYKSLGFLEGFNNERL